QLEQAIELVRGDLRLVAVPVATEDARLDGLQRAAGGEAARLEEHVLRRRHAHRDRLRLDDFGGAEELLEFGVAADPDLRGLRPGGGRRGLRRHGAQKDAENQPHYSPPARSRRVTAEAAGPVPCGAAPPTSHRASAGTSSRASSAADPYRSRGSFARHCWTIASSARISVLVAGRWNSLRSRAVRTCSGVPTNGLAPVIVSTPITPIAKRSVRSSHGPPVSASGAM